MKELFMCTFFPKNSGLGEGKAGIVCVATVLWFANEGDLLLTDWVRSVVGSIFTLDSTSTKGEFLLSIGSGGLTLIFTMIIISLIENLSVPSSKLIKDLLCFRKSINKIRGNGSSCMTRASIQEDVLCICKLRSTAPSTGTFLPPAAVKLHGAWLYFIPIGAALDTMFCLKPVSSIAITFSPLTLTYIVKIFPDKREASLAERTTLGPMGGVLLRFPEVRQVAYKQ
ncbi:hypothetical protein HHI36_002217 [Cryptolaemus montrouzieri]|uniref:Uncharacterized protein n=1 Tax=Cryptolaemus montrouzieri TaxID=559131 RepID=A0ABD2PAK1_9CUCU